MNVLSLFDGMSCGQQALDRLGVKVDNYFASEIDKYAIKITQKNYPDTIQLGDVCAIKAEDLPKIDLILAGSPCQGFSFAGKQLAFDDPRSALFFEFIRILKECKPKYFLLENVRMKKEYINIITEQVSECYPDYQGTGSDLFNNRIEPILINSALLSAQNRQRYYWTNIPNITQPKDRGIVLRDVLETNPSNDLDKMTTKDGKSYCLTARYQGAVYWNSLARKQRTMIPLVVQSYREVRTENAKRLRRESRQKTGKDHTPFRDKEIVPREDGKVGTVTPSLNNDHKISITTDQNIHWRKLTPLECERLQTVKDNYTEGVSNTQRYKMLGNGWTVEVICHILNNIN
jgi:DNA-cytosine methyltransferase